MRTRIALALGALATFLAGCGDEPAPKRVEDYLAAGQAAFARGDEVVQQARTEADFDVALDGFAEAVAAWMEAASSWRKGFRLLDPVEENAATRAMLAFRIARAFAKAARHGRDPAWAGVRADHAFVWLDQTARLAPGMRQVHYERARLFDSDIENARDLVAARAAYLRYLAAVDFSADSTDSLPASEQDRVKHARERAKVLAPPEDD